MRTGRAKGPPLVFRPLTPRLIDELGMGSARELGLRLLVHVPAVERRPDACAARPSIREPASARRDDKARTPPAGSGSDRVRGGRLGGLVLEPPPASSRAQRARADGVP